MEQQQKAPAEIKKIADFLRSGGAGLKIRVGALNGKRVDYFKGAFTVLSKRESELTMSHGNFREISSESPAFSSVWQVKGCAEG
jgi:hypothetical protein